MIVRITGVLEQVDASGAVIAVPETGLAYEVRVPLALAEDLADQVGRRITLHTLQHFEAHGQGTSLTPRLIGFATREDKRFFEVFTTVKGVGVRKALRAMAAPVPQIARAIAEKDVLALQRLPEIGKRLAETVIAELNGKVEGFLAHDATASLTEPKPALRAAAAQAVEALVRLGEPQAEAERMVRRAMDADAGLTSPDAILTAAFGMRE